MFADIGKPRVLLFQPNGLSAKPCQVDEAWYKPGWHWDERSAELLPILEQRSSSLVGAFNVGWTIARNMAERGEATHFAMLHADMWASAWWITDLLAEMRRYNAVVCAAHAMIKNHERDLTSTAVGPIDDPHTHRNLTADELLALPETITPQHVCQPGEVMVINTGCWVCDLRQPWVNEWVFPQTSAIDRDPATGMWRHRLRTEDWDLSRFLHAKGIRYIATRKVTTRHYGTDYWEIGPNVRPAPEPQAKHAS